MSDETIRLILELTGSSSIDEAAAKLTHLKSTVGETAQSYDVLDRKVGEFEVEARKATRAEDEAVRAAIEHTQAQRALNQVLEESVTATKSVVISAGGLGQTMHPSGEFGRGILQGSYAIQDFTSQLGTRGLAGALGAIQNNIPGILAGLGAGAGLAGALSVLSVGAGLLYEHWDKLTGLFTTTKEKLPELKEGLDGLKDSLKDIDDQIDKLEKQAKAGGLNIFDEEKLARLRGLKAEGLQRQADERIVAGIGENASRRSLEIQTAVKQAIAEAGGGNAVAQNLAMNLGLTGREATAVVAGAMRGNLADLATLQGGAPTFAGQYAAISPEAKGRQRQEAAIVADQIAELEQEQKARDRRNKQAEMLTEQGRQIEQRTFHERDREQEQDRVRGQREAQRAEKAAPLREAEAAVSRAARESGIGLTGEQVTEAAKRALDAVQQNVSANDAIAGSIAAVLNRAAQMQMQLQMQQARFWQLQQQANAMPQMGETRMGP